MRIEILQLLGHILKSVHYQNNDERADMSKMRIASSPDVA